MKKFLSCCLVAVMLVSVFAVGASALSWSAGAGFHAFEGESYSNKTDIGVSPVEFTDKGNSVDVKQGGYFDGTNIDAGVRTNEAVGLDGLEVTVDFKKAPQATVDCWFAIHLMQKPELFKAGNSAAAGNVGYVNLIRFGDPKLEMYDEKFSGLGSSEIGANDNIFAIKTGDKLTMKVRYEYGQYVFSYDHNGKTYEVPTDKTLSHTENVFAATGKAHVVVTGSLLGADNDWEYTVTVKEGEGISAEQLANAEFEKSKKVIADELEGYKAQIESFKNVATSAVEGKVQDDAIKASFTEFDAAKADLEAAITALKEAKDDAAVEEAKTAGGAALAKARSASEAIEQGAQFLEDVEEEAPVTTGDDVVDVDGSNGGGFSLFGLGFVLSILVLVAIILVVVVVVVVVVIVVLKKKKN